MNITVGEIIGNFILIAGSFLLLVFLIKNFAWGNIIGILDQRAQKISDDIDVQKLPVRKLKTWRKSVRKLWQAVGSKQFLSLRLLKSQLRRTRLES